MYLDGRDIFNNPVPQNIYKMATKMSSLNFFFYQSLGFCLVGTGSTRRKTMNMKDLFVEPNFNELDAVSTDSKELSYHCPDHFTLR